MPFENVGFNFDPSHLHWQEADYFAAVVRFRERIFHVHAKDVYIYHDRKAVTGVLGDGWWRYVIPGYGEIHWGRFIEALRDINYSGAVSVEHEDRTFGPEEGFVKAHKTLSQFI